MVAAMACTSGELNIEIFDDSLMREELESLCI
jgi:hypothetical protein